MNRWTRSSVRIAYVDGAVLSDGQAEEAADAELTVAATAAAPGGPEDAGAAERLDAEVPDVGDVDGAVLANRDAERLVERSVAAAESAPGRQEHARVVELLDAVIQRVGDVDVARRVQGNAGRVLELPVEAPKATPRPDKLTRVGELRDPLVVSVGDVDEAAPADRP